MVSSTFSRTASRRDAERLERLGRDAFALVDEPEQDVLGADEVVVEQARFLLGEDQDPSGSVSEAFEQVLASSAGSQGKSTRAPVSADPPGAEGVRRCNPVWHRHGSRVPWTSCSAASVSNVAWIVNVVAAPASSRARRAPGPGRGRAERLGGFEGPIPDRDRRPPDRGRRQAAAPRLPSGRPRRPSAEVSDDVSGGVAVELVHLGSLYHDDVIDEAPTRRGVESVNARWGNLVAIVAGDFLLARASEIAASLGTEVAGAAGRAPSAACARARSASSSTRSTRAGREEAYLRRSPARPLRCCRPPAGSAAWPAALPAHDRRADRFGQPSAWRSRSRRHPRPGRTDGGAWASRPATT